MTRRRPHRSPLFFAIAAIVLVAGIVLLMRELGRNEHADVDDDGGAAVVAADRIDPANEGRRVTIAGRLRAGAPASDTELGVEADAPVLIRDAEMFEWQERCEGSTCEYRKDWSKSPIDSSRFREPSDHANPDRFPIAGARFASPDVRLGAFRIDAGDLAAAGTPAAVDYPVSSERLPPNLAASFRDAGGALYAGEDPEAPAVGDLRIRYRVAPAVPVELTGVQHGDALDAAAAVGKDASSNAARE